MDSKEEVLLIRPYRSSDFNFIHHHWLIGNYKDNDWFNFINQETYKKNYSPFITRILNRPNIQINVCALREDEDVIIGYSVFEGTTLHWIYVKDVWRGYGISKDLITMPIKTVTHITNQGLEIVGDHMKRSIHFNPFIN